MSTETVTAADAQLDTVAAKHEESAALDLGHEEEKLEEKLPEKCAEGQSEDAGAEELPQKQDDPTVAAAAAGVEAAPVTTLPVEPQAQPQQGAYMSAPPNGPALTTSAAHSSDPATSGMAVEQAAPGGQGGRMRGKCNKWLDYGYGFITAENGENYFVHQTQIHAQGFRSLMVGEDVEFDLEMSDRGKMAAVKVTGPAGAYVKGAPYNPAARRGGRGGRMGFAGRGGRGGRGAYGGMRMAGGYMGYPAATMNAAQAYYGGMQAAYMGGAAMAYPGTAYMGGQMMSSDPTTMATYQAVMMSQQQQVQTASAGQGADTAAATGATGASSYPAAYQQPAATYAAYQQSQQAATSHVGAGGDAQTGYGAVAKENSDSTGATKTSRFAPY